MDLRHSQTLAHPSQTCACSHPKKEHLVLCYCYLQRKEMVLDNFWERPPRTGRRKGVDKHFPPLGRQGLP